MRSFHDRAMPVKTRVKPFASHASYMKLKHPVDKQMFGRSEIEWVETAKMNGWNYTANDEMNLKYWFRDVMRYLRRKAMEEGFVDFPWGRLSVRFYFEPSIKTVDKTNQSD